MPTLMDSAPPRASSGVEIERKFIVSELPEEVESARAERVFQGYLAVGAGVSEVRLRRRGDKTTLTVKQGRGRTRREEEIALDRDDFDRLWPLTEGKRVEKVRKVIPADGGLEIELDVYAAELDGLATAEVEFASEAEADAFEPPEWFGPEVTEDPRYKNQRLACGDAPAPPRAKPEPFALNPAEAIGPGIQRIVRGQIDLAIDQLGAGMSEDPGHAVHECRKSYKRVRAALRLVRDELGEETYRRENAAFRALGRALSAARDSQVLVETLDTLCERSAGQFEPGEFGGSRAGLVADHEEAEARLRENRAGVSPVIAELRATRGRVADWKFRHEEIEAVAPGFERLYRRARRAHRAVRKEPSDANLHELRKRTKDLRHAAETLAPAAPKTMQTLVERTRRLGELVGDDHDLAVLSQRRRVSDEHEAARLNALIARRRRKLQRRAVEQADRVFRHSPPKLRAQS